MNVDDPPASDRSWRVHSWARYIQSRPPLVDTIDWDRPLTFIVCGDAYPCAGGSWTQSSIGLLNHGKRGRTHTYLCVIAMAVCGDKDMSALATIWAENLQVPWIGTGPHVYCARGCLPVCGRELDPIVCLGPQPRQTGPHTRLLVGQWDGRVRRQRHGRFGHHLGLEPLGTWRFSVSLNSGSLRFRVPAMKVLKTGTRAWGPWCATLPADSRN